MHRILCACLLAFACFAFTACQSTPLKDFSTIKPGMEKHDVLETMGSPRRTQRLHGRDRWTYVFYEKKIRFEKEIQFFEGNATYIGDTWEPAPELSAPTVDQSNEVKNTALDAAIAREAAESRSAYENYEANIRGTSNNHTTDTPRYIPVFKPLR